MVPLDLEITMGACKIKAIQANLEIFRLKTYGKLLRH